MARLSCTFVVFLSTFTVLLPGTLCDPEEIAQQNLAKLATANNELALNLYQQLSSGSSENIFISPLSLSTAFGMVYYGAKGNTAQELRNVLGYEKADLPEALVHGTFQQYLTEVLPSQDASAYVLNSANTILIDSGLEVESSYKTEVQDLYQASIQDVNFTDSQKIIEDVNNWVKEKTNDKIDKLLEELDPFSVLIMLNAIYFNGTWENQFEPSMTMQRPFYNQGLESNAKEVPMMRLKEKLRYTSTPDAQVVELPYKGENLSMIILVPNELNGLEDIEKNLTSDNFSDILREMHRLKVKLNLPKFKIEYFKQMIDDFRSLGLNSIFSSGADFSGMTSNDVYVSQIVHKAVVEVNEEGSEAAAATGIVFSSRSSFVGFVPVIVADHPFLFAILDKRNDMIIFMGRVTNL